MFFIDFFSVFTNFRTVFHFCSIFHYVQFSILSNFQSRGFSIFGWIFNFDEFSILSNFFHSVQFSISLMYQFFSNFYLIFFPQSSIWSTLQFLVHISIWWFFNFVPFFQFHPIFQFCPIFHYVDVSIFSSFFHFFYTFQSGQLNNFWWFFHFFIFFPQFYYFPIFPLFCPIFNLFSILVIFQFSPNFYNFVCAELLVIRSVTQDYWKYW